MKLRDLKEVMFFPSTRITICSCGHQHVIEWDKLNEDEQKKLMDYNVNDITAWIYVDRVTSVAEPWVFLEKELKMKGVRND